MASNSPTVTPVVNTESFEDMLAEEANFTQSHQPRDVKFKDTVQGGLTSTPDDFLEEVALPTKPTFQSHSEETGFHTAAKSFKDAISKLKGGYTSSTRLVFQSWLKDICVHVEDRRLTQREAMQLVKDFTTECVE